MIEWKILWQEDYLVGFRFIPVYPYKGKVDSALAQTKKAT